jgi:flavorubredoxin
MKPVEVAEGIYWVGAIDWNIRDFHGYSTKEGTTYNAFLILDEKTTLIDTVKREFADELINNISQIIDPKKIDYVISNHTEMDHSGGLARVMHKIGEEKPIYCSKMGQKNLPQHYNRKWNYQSVEDGGELSLGKRMLTFMETRMVHWPDSMFTYAIEDKILFASDGFGQHYASMERFDDQVGDEIMIHAKKYFANILLLYTGQILKLFEKVQNMSLDLNIICPDHGIVWRSDPMKIVSAYVEWCQQKPKRKALIVYDSMWNSTQMMAEAMVDVLSQEGVKAMPMHLRRWHRSDIITEVLDAGAIIVGSPTLNNGLFPTIADFLTYLKGLKPKNKIGAAFGSYGWSGEAPKLINKEMEAMKFEVIDAPLSIKYVPDARGIEACHELGRKIAKALPAE